MKKDKKKNTDLLPARTAYAYQCRDVMPAEGKNLEKPNGTEVREDGGERLSLPPREGERSTSRERRFGRTRPRAATLGTCFVLLLGLAGVWLGALSAVGGEKHLPSTREEWGQTVCHLLLSSGLPDLQTPLWHKLSWEDDTAPSQEPLPDDTQAPSSAEIEIKPIDMSLSHLGALHWEGDVGCIPPAFGDISGILSREKRKVLVVCSRPYAVYREAEDGLTLPAHRENFAVQVPEDGGIPAEGTAALGIMLADLLSQEGIDVEVLSCATGTSYGDTYDETSAMVSDYLARNPDVGMVLDVGRSAELLPDGTLPQSMTEDNGVPMAQLRVTVHTGRGVGVSGDYTLAVRLRHALFDISQTVSRPVYLCRGEGLTCHEGVAFLSLDFGTAGNTYQEAAALVEPLSCAFEKLFS